MVDSIFNVVDRATAAKNTRKQASKIIKDIVAAYSLGLFDDPNSAYAYCSLLACICEGKIEGTVDEQVDQVKWSLTPEYNLELEKLKDLITAQANTLPNVVKGPWVQ